jgi:hypothetical protein
VEIQAGAVVIDDRHTAHGATDPAHAIAAAVGVASDNPRPLHGDHARRGEERGRAKVTLIQFSDQDVAQVLGAGNQIAAWHVRCVVAAVDRHSQTEEPLIALGQAVLLGGLFGCETMMHLQRGEDVLLHVALKRLAGNRLDDQAEHTVVATAILMLATDRPLEGDRA